MDTVWYFGYEEDSDFQTQHQEGSSVCCIFAERAVTSPQSYCTVRNVLVAELNLQISQFEVTQPHSPAFGRTYCCLLNYCVLLGVYRLKICYT